jgi:hypothetical protein
MILPLRLMILPYTLEEFTPKEHFTQTNPSKATQSCNLTLRYLRSAVQYLKENAASGTALWSCGTTKFSDEFFGESGGQGMWIRRTHGARSTEHNQFSKGLIEWTGISTGHWTDFRSVQPCNLALGHFIFWVLPRLGDRGTWQGENRMENDRDSSNDWRLAWDSLVHPTCFALSQVGLLIHLAHWFQNSFCFPIWRYINHVCYILTDVHFRSLDKEGKYAANLCLT